MLTCRCSLWYLSGLQTWPWCAARPAPFQGGACDLGAALSHSESAVYRVHETLPRSREQRLARSKPTQSLLRLLQGKAVFLAAIFFFFLSRTSTTFFSPDPSRSGITQTSSTKLCRRRIRQTSRTWTLMTSLQPVTPAALHRVLGSKPK